VHLTEFSYVYHALVDSDSYINLAFTVVDVSEFKAAVDAHIHALSAESQAQVPPVQVPLEYTEFSNVFESKQAEKLPPHCLNVDHEIPLVPNAKPV
jgi:hypothetical protein